MIKRMLLFLAVALLALSLVFAISPATSGEAQACYWPGISWVRIAHASPDAPAVDVIIDGWYYVATNLQFKGYTNYYPLVSGPHKIEVVPAGAREPVVISAQVPFDRGRFYTIAATNVLAEIAPVVYEDDNRWPTGNNTKVRFIHLSPDAPAVDIAVAGGGPVLFANISFTEVGDYIEVPGGTYDLEVRLAGTETVVLSVPGVTLKGCRVYTVFAEGLAGGEPPLQPVLVTDRPFLPCLK
jgi:hypothetical protein